MAQSLLYITFKDTVHDKSKDSLRTAIDNITRQLQEAAKRIGENPEAICDYLRQDLSLSISNAEELLDTKTSSIETKAVAPIVTEDDMLVAVFDKKLKRTSKSENIVRYFVQNSGIDLSVDQIASGASLTKNDLASWLAQTGKKIPAISNTSRGHYKFNPDQLQQ